MLKETTVNPISANIERPNISKSEQIMEYLKAWGANMKQSIIAKAISASSPAFALENLITWLELPRDVSSRAAAAFSAGIHGPVQLRPAEELHEIDGALKR